MTEGVEWLDRGANVLLFGAPGAGKGHLVSALGPAFIDAGRRVLFTSAATASAAMLGTKERKTRQEGSNSTSAPSATASVPKKSDHPGSL
ncbi:MAG: ATP-binding protein [Polaromonas sp.]